MKGDADGPQDTVPYSGRRHQRHGALTPLSGRGRNQAWKADSATSSGLHRLQPGFPQLAMAWLVNDFAVPSLLFVCLLLALACEAYNAARAALAACFSALFASDRADLDFLPIVVFSFRFWIRLRSCHR